MSKFYSIPSSPGGIVPNLQVNSIRITSDQGDVSIDSFTETAKELVVKISITPPQNNDVL